MNLEKLKDEIPYKWRLDRAVRSKKSSTGYYATCLAYIDARDAMDVLDKVVGQDNWQDKYRREGDRLVCSVGIFMADKGGWVWKEDTGTEGNFEGEKAEFSDAFKRACVKWGIGRFLYDLKEEWVEVVATEVNGKIKIQYPVDKDGNRIYDLTTYINNRRGRSTSQPKAAVKKKTSINREKLEKWVNSILNSEKGREIMDKNGLFFTKKVEKATDEELQSFLDLYKKAIGK